MLIMTKNGFPTPRSDKKNLFWSKKFLQNFFFENFFGKKWPFFGKKKNFLDFWSRKKIFQAQLFCTKIPYMDLNQSPKSRRLLINSLRVINFQKFQGSKNGQKWPKMALFWRFFGFLVRKKNFSGLDILLKNTLYGPLSKPKVQKVTY